MKRIVVLTVTILMALPLLGQKEYTAYLDVAFRETNKRKASYIRKLVPTKEHLFQAEVRSVEDQTLKMRGIFIQKGTDLIEHGEFTYYYPDGQVESSGIFEEGVKVGAWKRFTAQGMQRPDRYYDPARTEILKSVGSR